MPTVVLALNPTDPNPGVLARAAETLLDGGLVVYPTETVYGIAASAANANALARLSEAKQRPQEKAFPLQIASYSDLTTLADTLSPAVWELARALWPGPLTLIVRRKPGILPAFLGAGDTLAVRVPAHPVALGVLRACAVPLACPSANISGRHAPQTAADVLEDLDGTIDLLLDGGPTPSRTASTILNVTQVPAVVLRPGPISRQELCHYLPVLE